MAYRKELCTVGLLLLLSLLQTNQSASIVATHTMERLGKDALAHLLKVAGSALKNSNRSHSVGCIVEPKKHDCLNCTLICTFSSYLQAASELHILDDKLRNQLQALRQNVEDLRTAKCNNATTICEVVFQNRKSMKLEKVRSILVLFLEWIVKPLENC